MQIYKLELRHTKLNISIFFLILLVGTFNFYLHRLISQIQNLLKGAEIHELKNLNFNIFLIIQIRLKEQ